MKRSLIIGIILISIFLGLTIYRELNNKYINIHDITNKGLKTTDAKVYLNASFVAGTITGDDKNSYYVMFGDEVQYIVYMDNKEASRIERYLLDNPEMTYRIEGTTKLIPSSMEENGKRFIKEWLDNNHNHSTEEDDHDHLITTEDFYHYFGYVYLDSNKSIGVISIVSYLIGIMGILFIIGYYNTRYHFI